LERTKESLRQQRPVSRASSSNTGSRNGVRSNNNSLIADTDKPFHALHNKTWLHNRPEEDVYKLLIDVYRFRMEDNYTLEGDADADADSIYGEATDGGAAGFRRFLRLAQRKSALLPP
jgi:mitochondrial splicing suppressor protein 51